MEYYTASGHCTVARRAPPLEPKVAAHLQCRVIVDIVVIIVSVATVLILVPAVIILTVENVWTFETEITKITVVNLDNVAILVTPFTVIM